MGRPRKGVTAMDRILALLMLNGDCWETRKPRHLGYGRIMYHGKPTMMHRAVWMELVRECPPGEPHHLCRNRACSNPDHLEWGSHANNMAHERLAFCRRGLHRLEGDNLRINRRGGRQCRQCQLERERLLYAERTAHVPRKPRPARRPEWSARGEASGVSKLRDVDVREIRRRRKAGASYVQIGADFGITPENASYVARGITWAHIPMEDA